VKKKQKDLLQKAISRLQSAISGGATLAALAHREKTRSHTSEFVLATLARESEIRGAISESCAEWVKNGTYPLMSQDEALYFYERLFYGCAFARWLYQSGFSWTGGEQELLSFLLIDSWERISCLNWKHSLENRS
jgi:hypothetical protein